MGRACYGARGRARPRSSAAASEDADEETASAINRSVDEEVAEESVDPFVRTPARVYMHDLLNSPFSEVMTVCAILASMVCIVIETDRSAVNLAPLRELELVNLIVLGVYTVEAMCRFFVYRRAYFTSGWKLFDCFILIADYSMLVLENFVNSTSFSFLRILRLLRMARSARVLKTMPQLWFMVRGMIATVKIVVCGCLLICVFMLVIGVLAVQILHPVNKRVAANGVYEGCERCPRAFQSTASSVLTFSQQIIAGDSWGTVSMPIIEEEPATAIFFLFVFLLISLMVMNIILSMVVEASLKAAEDDKQKVLSQRTREYQDHANKVKAMCAELDADKSGELSKEELLNGFAENAEFGEMMSLMELTAEDFDEVFNMLDTEGTGNVEYDEFARHLYKLKTHDSRTTLALVKHYVTETREMLKSFVEEEFKEVQEALNIVHGSRPAVASLQDVMLEEKAKLGEASASCKQEDPFRRILLDIKEDLQAVVAKVAQQSCAQAAIHQPVEQPPHVREEGGLLRSESSSKRLGQDGDDLQSSGLSRCDNDCPDNAPYNVRTGCSGFCGPRDADLSLRGGRDQVRL
mmetsp:Transcript_128730/g.372516  ORF Transcript_128730/g.372516 Transcript_128730/m.372516 type:complete len:579 (-) Transcript_128730:104-1840(-)